MKEWIERIQPYFPVSQSVRKGEPASLLASEIIYLIAIVAVRLVVGRVLGAIWLIGGLFRLISAAACLYGLAGMVLSLYEYYR